MQPIFIELCLIFNQKIKNMKFLSKMSFVCVAAFFFMGCAKEQSENVNQDTIYSIYELQYNKNADKTTARATFRFGGPTGTLLELNSPALSSFNGDALSFNPTFSVHSKQYAGYTDSGVFVYTDLDNNTFTNNTPSIVPIDYTTLDTIDASNVFTFTWSGDPVSIFETVSLTINGTTQANFEIFATSKIGETQIILDANRLQKLGKGNAKCLLKRAYNKLSIEEGTSKGGRMNTFYEVEKDIFIK
jgi:hypothetical protein